jgi:L-threonylcarbamoyladenylate synthase
LRELDIAGCEVILIETPPAEATWDAVRDRLERACG